ncbi:tellurium resistance protein [Streptomyces sp. NPDC127132]|uniref:tellurium resistance protein n=1 Tax=Streptomyces sp. NPDC127132 TaxID=3345374 RepID=UPI003624F673
MSSDRPRGVIRLKPPTTDPTARPERPAPPRETAPSREIASTRKTAPVRRPDTLLTRSAPRGLVSGRGVLQANLNWSASTGADLDLGCLVEFTDGSRHVVQPLGNSFGSLTAPPYAQLDQDDRTGASSDGETLRLNLEHRARVRRLLVYTYVYEGAVDFRSLGAAVTVTAPSGGFRILLDDAPAGATACAIALIAAGADGLAVQREVRWFTATPWRSNQQLIDEAYGFGLEWVWCTKD